RRGVAPHGGQDTDGSQEKARSTRRCARSRRPAGAGSLDCHFPRTRRHSSFRLDLRAMKDIPAAPEVTLEIVGDRTASSKCDEGYLRVRRLDLRARWRESKEPSEPFAYDVVERWNADAVAVLPHFEKDGVRRIV